MCVHFSDIHHALTSASARIKWNLLTESNFVIRYAFVLCTCFCIIYFVVTGLPLDGVKFLPKTTSDGCGRDRLGSIN